jgi:hypothetical protein
MPHIHSYISAGGGRPWVAALGWRRPLINTRELQRRTLAPEISVCNGAAACFAATNSLTILPYAYFYLKKMLFDFLTLMMHFCCLLSISRRLLPNYACNNSEK